MRHVPKIRKGQVTPFHHHRPQRAHNDRAIAAGGKRGAVVSIVRHKDPSEADLESVISSAMLVADKELGHVIREVDELSKGLKAGAVDAETLRRMVRPAVWSAVRHVILERELRQLALTDDLTCLYNRRGFFAAATQQLKLARRRGQSMLLFFCDVDNLKFINDTFGHREGDLALIRAADALQEAFRDSDIVARLGGDEFAVLALEASSRNEQAMLTRLQKAIHKSRKAETRYQLSLSAGVARFEAACNLTLADLMETADHAMYENKKRKAPLYLKNA